MRNAILGSLLLLAATPAFADPCEVTVSRAPDDVRASIESWVAAEPSCSTTADVRVVATDGGYYLLAIGGDGTVHERVVPDAQSAGVLVASWIADTAAPGTSAPTPAPTPRVAVVEAPVAPTPMPEAESVAPVAVAATASAAHWLNVGSSVLFGPDGAGETVGLYATYDVKRWGRWSAGLSVGVSTDTVGYYEAQGVGAGVELAHTSTSGPWSLRLAGGLGAGVSSFRMTDPNYGMSTSYDRGVSVNASALVSREIRARWAFTAGPRMGASLTRDLQADQLKTFSLLLGVSHAF